MVFRACNLAQSLPERIDGKSEALFLRRVAEFARLSEIFKLESSGSVGLSAEICILESFQARGSFGLCLLNLAVVRLRLLGRVTLARKTIKLTKVCFSNLRSQ